MRALTVIIGLVLACSVAWAQVTTKSPRRMVEQGMAEFRAGKIKESIALFEEASKLQPELRAYLWQLGISYYYVGEYEKGRRIFEAHQKVNDQDVENAVWHFLCLSRVKNFEEARKNFIEITDDRRVPMMQVHGLFAGKLSEADVLEAARAGNPGDSERKQRLFYAHLYLGLFAEAEKRTEASLEHIKLAAGEYAQANYMGHVAKMHLKLRSPAP